ACPDDHGLGTADGHVLGFQHAHDAIRRARAEQRLAGHEKARIADMEAVDVFFSRDGFDDLGRVHVARQRQLDKNAVNGRVFIELLDDIQQFGFGAVLAHADHTGMQAGFLAGCRLVAHVDLGGRILADQHDRQPGVNVLCAQRFDTFGNFGAYGVRECLADDDAGCQAAPSEGVRAMLMRSDTVVTSRISMMLARWASADLMRMFASPAICLFRRPATRRSSACCSRAVRRLSTACWLRRARAWATRSLASTSMRATMSRNSASLKGFSRKSTAPFFMVETAIGTSPCPVMNTMGRGAWRASRTSCSSRPLMPGMRTSTISTPT